MRLTKCIGSGEGLEPLALAAHDVCDGAAPAAAKLRREIVEAARRTHERKEEVNIFFLKLKLLTLLILSHLSKVKLGIER